VPPPIIPEPVSEPVPEPVVLEPVVTPIVAPVITQPVKSEPINIPQANQFNHDLQDAIFSAKLLDLEGLL